MRLGASGRVLLAGGALLSVAWRLAPAPSPPLYDGLQGPAQAYIYVQPPAGYHQANKPSSASRVLAIANGSSGAGYANTEEVPPQAQVLVADGTFSTPPGAKAVTLTITPVAPPQPIPASLGKLAGNVYQVTATADVPGPVTVVPAHPATVVLRGPAGTGTPPIARLAEGSTTWEHVTTVPLGSAPDMVVTNTDRLGYFAITGSASAGSGGGSHGGGFPLGLVLGVGLPVLILIVVAATLLMREPPPPPPRRPAQRRR